MNSILSIIAGILLLIFYFISGLHGTLLGKLIEWLGFGGIINFFIQFNLIIFCFLISLFFCSLFSSKITFFGFCFFFLLIFIILFILYYFNVIPRLIV